MVYPNSFGHTTKRPSLNSCNHTCYNTWTFEKLLKVIPFKILGILQEQGKNSCCCKKYLRLPWPLWLSWLEVLPQRKGQWLVVSHGTCPVPRFWVHFLIGAGRRGNQSMFLSHIIFSGPVFSTPSKTLNIPTGEQFVFKSSLSGVNCLMTMKVRDSDKRFPTFTGLIGPFSSGSFLRIVNYTANEKRFPIVTVL